MIKKKLNQKTYSANGVKYYTKRPKKKLTINIIFKLLQINLKTFL